VQNNGYWESLIVSSKMYWPDGLMRLYASYDIVDENGVQISLSARVESWYSNTQQESIVVYKKVIVDGSLITEVESSQCWTRDGEAHVCSIYL